MNIIRKPDWLKIRVGSGENYRQVRQLVEENKLHTICSSGRCPNIGECWGKGTATLMILGDICTRSCKFCATKTGKPLPPDPNEPLKIARSVQILKLRHVVITSVDRDDLPDYGANHWAETITKCREKNPDTVIEILVPDFNANAKFLEIVTLSQPDIISHNIETVKRLTPHVRSKAEYETSLRVLSFFSEKGLQTKSGFMVGLGETKEEVFQSIRDLFDAGCRILTIGQYLQPTATHLPVMEYIRPDVFSEFKTFALGLGFQQVESGPLVRSSYMAEQSFASLQNRKIEIQKNVSLENLHTFKIDVKAENFAEVTHREQLAELFRKNIVQPVFVLGAGSNVLFRSNFNGTVVHIHLKGIRKTEENESTVTVSAAAGESWDSFVETCCKNGWYGLENLSLIPGTVGAAPVQNIGAFGVEAGDLICRVEVFDRNLKTFHWLNAEECIFGYRDSRFKHDWSDRYIVTEVEFKLSLNPVIQKNYEALKKALVGVTDLTPIKIRETVITIRKSRLPETDELGNAGSFFKNPVVSVNSFEEIRKKFPEVISYPFDELRVKLAAGWLIEQAGWKGKCFGNAGVYEKQALVLVNHGNASPDEIIHLAENITASIFEKFGVYLEPEVLII
jgi:lipoic acid synthetase